MGAILPAILYSD